MESYEALGFNSQTAGVRSSSIQDSRISSSLRRSSKDRVHAANKRNPITFPGRTVCHEENQKLYGSSPNFESGN